MTELERSPHDRRLYVLDGVGTVRLEGLFFHRATAEADGARWQFTRRGLWRPAVQAMDSEGAVVGEFVPQALRRSGTLRWAGRELTLRPASSWRERYALSDGDRELAILHGKGWGRRPVEVILDDPGAVDPGLLLFAAFVVRGLAEDANGAAGAGAGPAVYGS